MSVIRRLLLRKPLFHRHFSNFSATSSKILTSGLEDIKIPELTIDELVFGNFSKWENLVATECVLTGRKFTYKDTRIQSKNLSKSLRKKLKLKKGDVVAILLPNVPEFFIAALGILQAGLVITTINPLYTTEEIRKQLLDSSAKAIITLCDLWSLANASVKSAQKDIPILTVKTNRNQDTPSGAINFIEFSGQETDYPDANDRKPTDLAVLPYSSGTTGMPKGVKLSHYNVVANMCQTSHPAVAVNVESSETHQDITPAVLPLFHIYGFTVTCMLQMTFGAKVVTLPKFSPELYVSTLKKHKPNLLFLAPPIAIFLANHASVRTEDLQSVQSITSGAAPLGGLDEKKLLQKIQREVSILQGYGLTETSPAVLSTRSNEEFKNVYGSLGRPVPNTEVKLIAIDDTIGKPLGPNETGELLVRGPQVMMGYHNRPKETEDTFLDGWLRTGDMMYYNNDGHLFITDRLKELIKVKGFQVAPAELEEILRHHPDVSDAAVIGVPDPKDGELPRAYVVPRQGVKISTKNVEQFVNGKVASFKQIRGGISVIDSIPKNAAGKILRKELKALFQKEKQR